MRIPCRTKKCKYYESMKELYQIEQAGDGPCLGCRRFYPDKFIPKEKENNE